MKRSWFIKIIVISLFTVTFIACDENQIDNIPPSPPKDVSTLVGDGEVEIQWDRNPEGDVAGYNVYYATDYWGKYTLIGNTPNNYFVDADAENGVVYYYGVAAYDYNGNESELSYDEVYGIARPQGMNQSIFDYLEFPNTSGYDFSEFMVVPYNANTDDFSSDVFFENFEGTFYLNVWKDSDIQDMGNTNDIYDIPYAPTTGGWVPLLEGDNVKYTEATIGHTYVIWTWDDHFAKIRIKEITTERMVFDWAYQLIEGEKQLKARSHNEKRNMIPGKVIKQQMKSFK